jgi:hypothetical protein
VDVSAAVSVDVSAAVSVFCVVSSLSVTSVDDCFDVYHPAETPLYHAYDERCRNRVGQIHGIKGDNVPCPYKTFMPRPIRRQLQTTPESSEAQNNCSTPAPSPVQSPRQSPTSGESRSQSVLRRPLLSKYLCALTYTVTCVLLHNLLNAHYASSCGVWFFETAYCGIVRRVLVVLQTSPLVLVGSLFGLGLEFDAQRR